MSNRFIFSDEQLLSACEMTDAIVCDCTAHLAGLLWQVRKFYYYTTDCVDRSPEQVENYSKLQEQTLQAEALLSQALLELMQQQGLLDENQQINIRALKERQVQALLHHPPLS